MADDLDELDDVHELAALYALDALTGDDRLRFEAHLDECERCGRQLDALRATAAHLAYVPEGPAPPNELRDRILVAARAEPQNVVSLASRRSRRALVAVASIAVAASAAAIGFGVWASSLHSSLTHAQRVEAVLANPRTRRLPLKGASGALYVSPSGTAALAVALPQPPTGKTYEAWVIPAKQHAPQRAAVFSGGTTLLAVPVRPGSAVAVTVEKAGGVDAPTASPILSTQA
jgi:anti-sigma factor RsiW